MKRIGRLISGLMICIVLFGSCIPVCATQTNIKILENDEKICTVQETTETKIIISKFEKRKNFLTVEEFDRKTKEKIATKTLDLEQETIQRDNISTFAMHRGNGDKYQHTFSNREYDIWYGSPNDWKVRSKDSIKWVEETKKNSSYLDSFLENVEEINEQETKLIITIGSTAGLAALNALVSGGLGAAIAVVGGSATAASILTELNSACNSADHYFKKL